MKRDLCVLWELDAASRARLEELSREADLEPELAKKFLTFIISEVIRHHEKLHK